MKHEVIIYSYPYSKLCTDCENSQWLQSEIFDENCFICDIRCRLNNGLVCPYQVKKGIPNEIEKEEKVTYSFFNH